MNNPFFLSFSAQVIDTETGDMTRVLKEHNQLHALKEKYNTINYSV